MTLLETKPRRPVPEPNEQRPSSPDAKRSSWFGRYFVKYGWVHALLLTFVWLFLFPFLWMLSTSIKTDEELPEGRILPAIPTFRPSSPYVKPEVTPQRPIDVAVSQWETLLPRLTEIASRHIAKAQHDAGKLETLVPVDADAHRRSAASVLVNQIVARLQKDNWNKPDAELLSTFESLLTHDEVTSALHKSLATLELLTFQLRTLDVHLYPLTSGADFVKNWRVESGPAKLLPSPSGDTLLSYDFSKSSEDIVVRYDFNLPPGVKSEDLHRIIVGIQADNSWHRVNTRLDLPNGQSLTSRRTTYIAQFRPLNFLFQPPTYDDEILRPHNWIPLRPDDSSQHAASNTQRATLRLIISPANTLQANYGKFIRNYLRAFDQVPFWRFFSNSLILVFLNTIGALFSSAFVAYAFARLNWPGRAFAFLLLLSSMMLPDKATMIPTFLIWRALGWYNTLNPLWVPAFVGNAFFIFLMTQHMRTIPRELEEAARLDGLNPVQSWYYVILPNVKPTLAAIAILQFLATWNEFMGPLIYIRDQAKFPLALGLYGLKVDQSNPQAPDWTLLMAGNMLMTVPVIAVFFLFQRYFVRGVTLTGMKG